MAALAVAASAAYSQVHLTAVPSGAMKMVGFYMPNRLKLSDEKPPEIKVVPPGLVAPSYAVLKAQGKAFGIIVDRLTTGDTKLYVDANGDGDLTNDPAATWSKKTYPSRDGSKQFNQYMGTFQIELNLDGKATPVTEGVYLFDKNDPSRAQVSDSLFYYSDFAEKGTVKLASKTYPVILIDETGTASFTGSDTGGKAMLLIDRNGTGNYGLKGESYPVDKPFNIDGTTYEIKNLSADGSTFKVVKSAQTVAEVKVPVKLGAGQKAWNFAATTTGGKSVSFPTAYKHKVVLLDFWATWCGPCMGEVPNVVATYNKYHDQGFEILGISLDNEKTSKDVASVTHDKGMTWEQVCDAKFWDAAVAKLYDVESIPQAYLVDGDTGVILAEGEQIRGDGLGKAVEAALAKHAPVQK